MLPSAEKYVFNMSRIDWALHIIRRVETYTALPVFYFRNVKYELWFVVCYNILPEMLQITSRLYNSLAFYAKCRFCWINDIN